MPKVDAFTAAVKKARKAADAKPLAKAIGKVVGRRLRKPRPQRLPTSEQPRQNVPSTPTQRRRTGRRRGRNQHYVATAKVDISRMGTFRHYMLATIRKHEWTWDADREHSQCDNPKFAKNKLDFGWAAAEGYITFI